MTIDPASNLRAAVTLFELVVWNKTRHVGA